MEELRFTWNKFKATANQKKHDVSFEEASSVFYDENAILYDDPKHSQDEERFIILGMSHKANILIVCHCYREEESIIRIISARKADNLEINEYIIRKEN